MSASDGTNVVKVSKCEIWLSLSFILLHCFKMQVLVVEVVVGGVGLGMRLGKGICFLSPLCTGEQYKIRSNISKALKFLVIL